MGVCSFLLKIEHEGVWKPVRDLNREGETVLAGDSDVVGALADKEFHITDICFASVLRI